MDNGKETTRSACEENVYEYVYLREVQRPQSCIKREDKERRREVQAMQLHQTEAEGKGTQRTESIIPIFSFTKKS